MSLSKVKYSLVQAYKRQHQHGVSLARFLYGNWLRWGIFSGAAASSYFLVVPSMPEFGWASIGLFLGAALRDIGHFRMVRRIWPMVDRITDWQKVDDLIDFEAPANAAG